MEAVGRIPNTDKLNLELLKMKTENGAIKVDKYFETSVENVYAIGDVIDRIQLTPVAIAEAMIFVENLKLKKKNLLIIQISPRLYFVILIILLLVFRGTG